jgi:hypothetical protein
MRGAAKSFASRLAPTLDLHHTQNLCGSEPAREGVLSDNTSLTTTPLSAVPRQAV